MLKLNDVPSTELNKKPWYFDEIKKAITSIEKARDLIVKTRKNNKLSEKLKDLPDILYKH